MPKMYFAEIVNTLDGNKFTKFGHTSYNDAQKRLDRITEEYPHFKARVLASVYHHDVEVCKNIEEEYKAKYPKNFWLDEKLSGITECVKLEWDIRNNIIKELRAQNEQNKKELFG